MNDTIDSSQSGGDAAIVRVHGTNKALAICSDCNPHYVSADPYEGGKQAVAEAYRNLSAVGATPIAITDNLNFGNPEKPATMGYIVKAIEGMAEACRVLDFPVVSGNVSLYNETDGKAIPPTPVVGGVGLIDDLSKIATLKGAQPGDALIIIGENAADFGASLYARKWLGLKGDALGPPPPVDLEDEIQTSAIVRQLIAKGLVHAVHDLSDGGLAVAAAEMALAGNVGITLDVQADRLGGLGPLAFLFSETQGRYLVAAKNEDDVLDLLGDIPALFAGTVENTGAITFLHDLRKSEKTVLPLKDLRAAHEGWLPGFMNAI